MKNNFLDILGYKYLNTKDINGNELPIKPPDDITNPKDEKNELLHIIGIFNIATRSDEYLYYDNKTNQVKWITDFNNNEITFFRDLKSAKKFLKSLEFNDILLKIYHRIGYVFISGFDLYKDVLALNKRQNFAIYYDEEQEKIKFKKI